MKTICLALLNAAVLCGAFFSPPPARASVTNVVWYHFGEGDPGAVSGGTVTTSVDSVNASNNLVFHNSPRYTNDVAQPAAAHAGSSLSVVLPTGAWATNKIISTATDNFGIEAWVRPVELTNGQVIAYNGSTATSGWGIGLGPTNFFGLYGGRAAITATPAQTNVWTHLALVRSSGIAIFYVNGAPVATNTVNVPAVPTVGFAVGAPPQAPTNQFFTGGIDEVRVFTFAAGQFSTNDLLINQPELVTSLADNGAAGTLRTVLANADPGSSVTFATNGQITLTNGPITVASNANLAGPGPGNIVISGNHSGRVLLINSGSTNSVSGLTIRDGAAGSDLNNAGGGIYNLGDLTLSNCEIAFNTAHPGAAGFGSGGGFPPNPPSGGPGGNGGSGGGVFNLGSLVMMDCFVHDNEGGLGGPGGNANNIAASPGNGGTGGNTGGLYNSGTTMLLGCAFHANTGGPGGGAGSPGQGFSSANGGNGGSAGAIYNDTNGWMTVIDCTIDGNAAGAGGPGSGPSILGGGVNGLSGTNGGIVNLGLLEMYNDTITRNNGYGSAGGVYNGGEATAQNTLIASNAAQYAPDYLGSFSTQGHNLIGDNQGAFGFFVGNDNDIVGVTNAPIDPGIGAFSTNGGPTGTVPLLAGSPAIDAGDDTALGAPNFITTDQRGLPRKSGAHVDIGAYETIIGFPPRLVPAGTGTNAGFVFTFTNTPHADFSVFAATNPLPDLANWTLLGPPAEITPGLFQFADPVTNAGRRFYLVISP